LVDIQHEKRGHTQRIDFDLPVIIATKITMTLPATSPVSLMAYGMPTIPAPTTTLTRFA
jgi:hypothetical protein